MIQNFGQKIKIDEQFLIALARFVVNFDLHIPQYLKNLTEKHILDNLSQNLMPTLPYKIDRTKVNPALDSAVTTPL